MNSVVRTPKAPKTPDFKTILDSYHEETLNSLRRLEAEQRALNAERQAEIGDFCVESAVQEDLFERITQQRRLLLRVEAALRRIEYGTFGECSICRNEISSRRLEVMPWTEYCVRCQEDFERATISRSTWSALRRANKSGR